MQVGELKKILEHVPDEINLGFTVACDGAFKELIEKSLDNEEFWLRFNGYSRCDMDLIPIEDQVFMFDFIPEKW